MTPPTAFSSTSTSSLDARPSAPHPASVVDPGVPLPAVLDLGPSSCAARCRPDNRVPARARSAVADPGAATGTADQNPNPAAARPARRHRPRHRLTATLRVPAGGRKRARQAPPAHQNPDAGAARIARRHPRRRRPNCDVRVPAGGRNGPTRPGQLAKIVTQPLLESVGDTPCDGAKLRRFGVVSATETGPTRPGWLAEIRAQPVLESLAGTPSDVGILRRFGVVPATETGPPKHNHLPNSGCWFEPDPRFRTAAHGSALRG